MSYLCKIEYYNVKHFKSLTNFISNFYFTVILNTYIYFVLYSTKIPSCEKY